MKLCIFVQNLYTLGGIQRVVTTVINELCKDSNYEITVVMPSDNAGKHLFDISEKIIVKNEEDIAILKLEGIVKYIFAANKRLGILDNKMFLPFVKRIRFNKRIKQKVTDFINDNKYDVVIGAGLDYNLLLGEISDKVSAKTVAWNHTTFEAYFEKRGRNGFGLYQYGKYCYKKNDAVWVLTNADRKIFDKKFGINSITYYNSIQVKEDFESKADGNTIIFVGRLNVVKGIDFLVEIMDRMRKKLDKCRLLIVGDGPHRKWIEESIRNRNLNEYISMVGVTDDVYQYYEKSSLMLQTSRVEGFGMTIIEAMSCGIPVVSFHNLGPDEIIRDGKDGYLIEQYNIDDFVKKSIRILTDDKLRQEFSEASKERAKDFRLEKLLPEFKQNVEKLVLNDRV